MKTIAVPTIYRGIDMALLDSPGGRIKLARLDKGLSGVQFLELLENKLGKGNAPSAGHLSHIESGSRKPSIDLAIAIADILEISLDAIYDREVKAKSEPVYTEAVERAADMLQAMDDDMRALLLHNIEVIYSWDQERKELHQEFWEFLNMAQPDPKRRSGIASRLRRGHRTPNTSRA